MNKISVIIKKNRFIINAPKTKTPTLRHQAAEYEKRILFFLDKITELFKANGETTDKKILSKNKRAFNGYYSNIKRMQNNFPNLPEPLKEEIYKIREAKAATISKEKNKEYEQRLKKNHENN